MKKILFIAALAFALTGCCNQKKCAENEACNGECTECTECTGECKGEGECADCQAPCDSCQTAAADSTAVQD